MDSIADLLKDSNTNEPPQIKAIKKYITDKFDKQVKVQIGPSGFIIDVPDSPTATLVRMDQINLKKSCEVESKIFIRISHF